MRVREVGFTHKRKSLFHTCFWMCFDIRLKIKVHPRRCQAWVIKAQRRAYTKAYKWHNVLVPQFTPDPYFAHQVLVY